VDDAPQILVSDEGLIRLVTLNRPHRLNAFTDVGYELLGDVLRQADAAEGIKVVLLEGAGRGFSSGVDLDAFRDGDRAAYSETFGRLLDALVGLSKPLVAAVHGAAVGFGATLLLHCDLVIVADDARIRFPFTQLGTAPEAGSSWLLPAAVGAQRAADLILTSRWVSGTEAVHLGLAARSVVASDLASVARATAREIASHPLSALVAAKGLLKSAAAQAVPPAIAREAAQARSLSMDLASVRDRRTKRG
jgi:enoyl-CoA hydratase/carnithine racemase